MNQQPNPEIYGIGLDLASGELDLFPIAEKPENHSFGMFVSHRTGTLCQMETLRQNVINKSLGTLRKLK